MSTLVEALNRFNRKERNLLIRAIVGNEEGRLPLNRNFLNEVTRQLKLDNIPEDAWWGTDYHISWLAGALAVFTKGESALDDRYPNPLQPVSDDGAGGVAGELAIRRQLIEGNQEDFDLVIATESDLILIEVKAYSTFRKDNRQLSSKQQRLSLLRLFYDTLAPEPSKRIFIHFLLMSPVDPELGIPWIKLRLDGTSILEVTRCDDNGRSTSSGDRWRVQTY